MPARSPAVSKKAAPHHHHPPPKKPAHHHHPPRPAPAPAPPPPGPPGTFYDTGIIPEGGEIWQVGTGVFVVYHHNGTPLAWWIEDPKRVEEIFGGKPIRFNRTMSDEEFRRTGAVQMGASRSLKEHGDDFLKVFLGNFEKAAQVMPWLKDREVLSLYMAAALEGRTPHDWELQTTKWWRSRTEGERQWVKTLFQDPSTAQRLLNDSRVITLDAMQKAGISGYNDDLVNFVADKLTTGQWSKEYYQSQIALLADPFAHPLGQAALDPQLKKFAGRIDQTRKGEDEVREFVNRWVGPAVANGWKDDHVKYWAGKFRNDPDAKTNLGELLRKQFQSMFPVYADNPMADYESVAGAWRSVVNATWGQDPDERDPMFLKIIAMNDGQAAGELLRQEGLKRGVGKVVEEAVQGLAQQFNFGVRPRAA